MTIPILPEQESDNMFLYVHSPAMSSGNMSVYTGSSGDQSLSATMLMAGMPSENAPLYIGPASGVITTGDFMLYVDAVEGGGAQGFQGVATLSLKGTESSSLVSSHNLNILGPESIENTQDATLFIDAGDWIAESGVMPLSVQGGVPASGHSSSSSSMFIRNQDITGQAVELVPNGEFAPTGVGLGSYGDGAFASYSVSRKVNDDYVGPLVRITRVEDSDERDFYEGEIEGEEISGEIINNADFGGLAHWSAANGFNITGGQAVNDGTNTSTATLFQNDPWLDFEYYVLEFEIISCSDFYSAGMRVGQALNRNFGTYFDVVTAGKRRVLINPNNFASDPANSQFFGFFAEAGVSLTVEYVSLKGYSASEAERWVSANEPQPMNNGDSNGLVSKLYDQSGNSRHLEAVLSRQPSLLVRGVSRIGQAYADSKRGSASFSGSRYMQHDLSSSMDDSYPLLSSIIGSHKDAHSGFMLSLYKDGTSSTYIGHTLRDLSGNDIGYWGVRDGGSVSPATEPATADEFHHSVGWSTGTSSHNIYVDDSPIDTDTTSVDFPTGLDTINFGRLRSVGSQFVFKGNSSEIILHNSDVVGDIPEMQKNSNAYYGIYEMADGSYYGWSLVNASLSAGTVKSNASVAISSAELEDVNLVAGVSYDISMIVNDISGTLTGTLNIEIGGVVVHTISGSGYLGEQSFSVQPTTGGKLRIISDTSSDKWQVSKFSMSESSSGGATLFIEKDFNSSEYTKLFLQNNEVGADALPMSISGKFIQTDDISLFLKPPEAGDTTLFNRGFSE